MGDLSQSLNHIRQLHGRKYLVPGNHDRCWPHDRKYSQLEVQRYTGAGFTVLDTSRTLQVGGLDVTLHHFPYRGSGKAKERYLQHRPVDTGGWLLHGHVHDAWRQNERMINVGVDAWNGAPVALDALASLVELGPAHLDRHGRRRPG
jgi:calcineurin-like phosphoesterase family protein